MGVKPIFISGHPAIVVLSKVLPCSSTTSLDFSSSSGELKCYWFLQSDLVSDSLAQFS